MMMEDGLRCDEMFIKTLFSNRHDNVQMAMEELRKNHWKISTTIISMVESMYHKK